MEEDGPLSIFFVVLDRSIEVLFLCKFSQRQFPYHCLYFILSIGCAVSILVPSLGRHILSRRMGIFFA